MRQGHVSKLDFGLAAKRVSSQVLKPFSPSWIYEQGTMISQTWQAVARVNTYLEVSGADFGRKAISDHIQPSRNCHAGLWAENNVCGLREKSALLN